MLFSKTSMIMSSLLLLCWSILDDDIQLEYDYDDILWLCWMWYHGKGIIIQG